MCPFSRVSVGNGNLHRRVSGSALQLTCGVHVEPADSATLCSPAVFRLIHSHVTARAI